MRLFLALFLSTLSVQAAVPERTVFEIRQSGLVSNGFGTSWRGQDLVFREDTIITRVAIQGGLATAQIDEIRIQFGNAIVAATTQIEDLGADAEGILAVPFHAIAGRSYALWFHQRGVPQPTFGCDLRVVDPTWRSYHTDVDPTQAPGAGEPSYYWGHPYGTNVTVTGYDNLESTGALQPGGFLFLTLEAEAFDRFAVFLSSATAEFTLPPFQGVTRLSPLGLTPFVLTGQLGLGTSTSFFLPIPNDPALSGGILHFQALHDPTFAAGGRFSTLETVRIQ